MRRPKWHHYDELDGRGIDVLLHFMWTCNTERCLPQYVPSVPTGRTRNGKFRRLNTSLENVGLTARREPITTPKRYAVCVARACAISSTYLRVCVEREKGTPSCLGSSLPKHGLHTWNTSGYGVAAHLPHPALHVFTRHYIFLPCLEIWPN